MADSYGSANNLEQRQSCQHKVSATFFALCERTIMQYTSNTSICIFTGTQGIPQTPIQLEWEQMRSAFCLHKQFCLQTFHIKCAIYSRQRIVSFDIVAFAHSSNFSFCWHLHSILMCARLLLLRVRTHNYVSCVFFFSFFNCLQVIPTVACRQTKKNATTYHLCVRFRLVMAVFCT